MPYGSSQVVGLIEIDAPVQSYDEFASSRSHHPLRPPARPRKGRSLRGRAPAPITEIVRADLPQINEDLHVELASILVHIAAGRRRGA